MRRYNKKRYLDNIGESTRPYDDEYYLYLHNQVDFSKYNKVSDIPEFLEFAKARSWKNRRDLDRGYGWRTDPFEFVRNEYGPWIRAAAEQGLTLVQSDLLVGDESLWQRLQQDIHKRGLPSDINLPSEKQARLEAIDDPEERKLVEAHREYERLRRARIRAAKPTP